MADSILTQQRLKECLRYDPETGVFSRLLATSLKHHVGEIAGWSNSEGYLHIMVDKKTYKAHRLAFLYMAGAFPAGHVDHKNGTRSDNRWSNLREVTQGGNLQNQRKAKRGSSTGYLGVKPCPRDRSKFMAQISVNKKRHHLGTFGTPEAAHDAYLKAKRELHSTCTI